MSHRKLCISDDLFPIHFPFLSSPSAIVHRYYRFQNHIPARNLNNNDGVSNFRILTHIHTLRVNWLKNYANATLIIELRVAHFQALQPSLYRMYPLTIMLIFWLFPLNNKKKNKKTKREILWCKLCFKLISMNTCFVILPHSRMSVCAIEKGRTKDSARERERVRGRCYGNVKPQVHTKTA